MPISYAYFDASLSGKNAGRKCADEPNQDKTHIAWAASDFAAEECKLGKSRKADSVKLTFLGTRGYIEPKSSAHRLHTSMMVTYRGRNVMVDCGESWLRRVRHLKPDAIVITHAHPDHAFGLKDGSPCPVYATLDAWLKMKRFAIPEQFRKTIQPRKPAEIAGVIFEAFRVMHSVLAPAVGYRISAGNVVVFYVPDVARIPNLAGAFSGIRLYIGDGATITRPLTRRPRRNGQLIGHASIYAQLAWCRKEGVRKMIVTHCGSAIVGGKEEHVRRKLRNLGRMYGVTIQIAYDGMGIVLQ